MSLIAGVYSLHGREVSKGTVEAIRRSLDRAGDPQHEFLGSHFYLAKVDVGAFGASAFLDDDMVAAVTGEPLLARQPGEVSDRSRDLERLVALTADSTAKLRDCRGTFSFVRYDPRNHELLLATDLLGARAVYCSFGPEFLYFSSNLRVLESLAEIPKRMDLRAIVELSSFGSPLSDRTPYVGICNLRGAEFVQVRDGQVHRNRYFRWSEVPATKLSRADFEAEAYRVFLEAVACRAARHSTAVSFLTGGLDSRIVTAALAVLEKKIFTINFKYSGLMDSGIAARVAEALGTTHIVWPVSHKSRVVEWTCSVPAKIRYEGGDAPEHPRAVFSGDGGSVGLGFVYMDERIVSLSRADDLSGLAEYYLRKKQLARRVFRPEAYRRMHQVPLEGLRSELESAGGLEPAKNFHLFLMNNDQRRHIHPMYEDLDLNQVEYLLPLYDARWLELIASAPVDWFLLHRFYNDWLRLFPASISAIPWQVYPGHAPCPLDRGGSDRPQWNLTKKERYQANERTFRASVAAILRQSYPRRLFRPVMLWSAAFLHGARIKNYDYVWNTFAVLRKYGERCGQRMRWPSENAGTGQ